MSDAVIKDLQAFADPDKAALLQRFFKTGKGQYAEGDLFLGISVPNSRKVAKKYRSLTLSQVKTLLTSKFHEHRLTALLILVDQYAQAPSEEREAIVRFYLQHTKYINNWDLVDLSAPRILGEYLKKNDRAILYQLARSPSLWERRISVLATFAFIRQDDFSDNLKIATLLLADREDLIHKAVGWMLREVGKRQVKVEEQFLEQHAATMPRTALRYALEHFPSKKREYYMTLPRTELQRISDRANI